ncbi:MAG: hypothetical protein KDN22_02080 [Verrucomicrobiae bacterium]|nr:hypothetical protein [Verrucomicrobiae bacterium]
MDLNEEHPLTQNDEAPRKTADLSGPNGRLLGAALGGAVGILASRLLGLPPRVGVTIGSLVGANADKIGPHVFRGKGTGRLRLADECDDVSDVVAASADLSSATTLLRELARDRGTDGLPQSLQDVLDEYLDLDREDDDSADSPQEADTSIPADSAGTVQATIAKAPESTGAKTEAVGEPEITLEVSKPDKIEEPLQLHKAAKEQAPAAKIEDLPIAPPLEAPKAAPTLDSNRPTGPAPTTTAPAAPSVAAPPSPSTAPEVPSVVKTRLGVGQVPPAFPSKPTAKPTAQAFSSDKPDPESGEQVEARSTPPETKGSQPASERKPATSIQAKVVAAPDDSKQQVAVPASADGIKSKLATTGIPEPEVVPHGIASVLGQSPDSIETSAKETESDAQTKESTATATMVESLWSRPPATELNDDADEEVGVLSAEGVPEETSATKTLGSSRGAQVGISTDQEEESDLLAGIGGRSQPSVATETEQADLAPANKPGVPTSSAGSPGLVEPAAETPSGAEAGDVTSPKPDAKAPTLPSVESPETETDVLFKKPVAAAPAPVVSEPVSEAKPPVPITVPKGPLFRPAPATQKQGSAVSPPATRLPATAPFSAPPASAQRLPEAKSATAEQPVSPPPLTPAKAPLSLGATPPLAPAVGNPSAAPVPLSGTAPFSSPPAGAQRPPEAKSNTAEQPVGPPPLTPAKAPLSSGATTPPAEASESLSGTAPFSSPPAHSERLPEVKPNPPEPLVSPPPLTPAKAPFSFGAAPPAVGNPPAAAPPPLSGTAPFAAPSGSAGRPPEVKPAHPGAAPIGQAKSPFLQASTPPAFAKPDASAAKPQQFPPAAEPNGPGGGVAKSALFTPVAPISDNVIKGATSLLVPRKPEGPKMIGASSEKPAGHVSLSATQTVEPTGDAAFSRLFKATEPGGDEPKPGASATGADDSQSADKPSQSLFAKPSAAEAPVNPATEAKPMTGFGSSGTTNPFKAAVKPPAGGVSSPPPLLGKAGGAQSQSETNPFAVPPGKVEASKLSEEKSPAITPPPLTSKDSAAIPVAKAKEEPTQAEEIAAETSKPLWRKAAAKDTPAVDSPLSMVASSQQVAARNVQGAVVEEIQASPEEALTPVADDLKAAEKKRKSGRKTSGSSKKGGLGKKALILSFPVVAGALGFAGYVYKSEIIGIIQQNSANAGAMTAPAEGAMEPFSTGGGSSQPTEPSSVDTEGEIPEEGANPMGTLGENPIEQADAVEMPDGAIVQILPAGDVPRQTAEVPTMKDGIVDPIVKEFEDARSVVRSLLLSSSTDEAAQWVHDPATTSAMMKAYYGSSGITPTESLSIDLVNAGTVPGSERNAYLMKVTSADHPEGFPVSVEETADGYKVDWDAYIQCKDRLLEKYYALKPAVHEEFYVTLKRSHHFDPDGTPGTGVLNSKLCFKVSSPLPSDASQYVYADPNSVVGRELEARIQWNKVYFPVIELEWVPADGDHNGYMRISKFVRDTWRKSRPKG